MSRKLSFVEAINEAMFIAMKKDKKVLCYGLGVDDPKRIFGTTKGLKEKFGDSRVFDMPTSENAMTGISIGAGLSSFRSIMVHQRLDFFLLAMDQLVNGAAKWHYMFGGQKSVPITIRLIIGRGWGQGPTHSQSLQSWFAHIPGLKVVMPSNAYDAKGMLLSSIFDISIILIFTIIIFSYSFVAINNSFDQFNDDDPQEIVIDEVVGQMLTLIAIPVYETLFPIPNIYYFISAFLLFRLFDVWKPFPVSYVDNNFKGAMGIMLDDIFASFYAITTLCIILFFLGG